ncbi:hypothetical protein [Actinoplanes sp. M2I2]|uniref:hypothetical protein n=1 Tax=Actinoplanes sp. M2I2 TaxID=1734444 RepID=UPI0020217C49|nr:hypothetical protein [Actinoplanes sp. M2I2]
MDTTRSLALAGACAAFVAVPNLGALLGEGEQTKRYDTAITPPDYAFAVWAPIFATCVASTVGQCLPSGRGDAVSRRTGWPLAGAYAVNAAWSLAAQRDRFALTPYLLPVAAALAATAHARLQQAPPTSGLTAVTPVSTGLLLGWTTLASAVNVVAARDRNAPRTTAAASAGLLTVAAAVAAGVARSRRGGLSIALGTGWGLGTLAGMRTRRPAVRLAAALGAAAIGVADLAGRFSHGRRG